MPYGLYISADGAQAQLQRMDVIANNLANVDTTGFKRELGIVQARYAEAAQQGLSAAGAGSIDDLGGGVRLSETKTDFSAGALQHTGNPTDLAIKGDGFFLVRKDDQEMLTRAGNFRLTSGGRIGHPGGIPGARRQPRADRRSTGRRAMGDEFQRRPPPRRDFADPRPGEAGVVGRSGQDRRKPLSPLGQPRSPAAGPANVASGYLEMSGVKPTSELIDMLETSRLVEANINMIQTQDQMLNGLISRILKA